MGVRRARSGHPTAGDHKGPHPTPHHSRPYGMMATHCGYKAFATPVSAPPRSDSPEIVAS